MSEVNWPTTRIKESSYLKGRIGWQGLKASEFIDDGPFLITGTDFNRRNIDWNKCYHVTQARFLEASYIHVRDGDLLITKDGTIGKVVHVRGCPDQAVLNSGIFLLRCRDRSYEHEYLYHILTSHIFDEFLRLNLAGSTINHLYQNVFERFEFSVPELAQQRRIAEILSTVDDAIEATEALIAKQQQIKQGLIHDLFTRGVWTTESIARAREAGSPAAASAKPGQLRPCRETAPELYQESPLGWIPKDWEVLKLGEILRRFGGRLQTGPFGSQLHAHEYQSEGVPVVMPQDINDGCIGVRQIARIHERRAEELGRHRMRVGDIVIARRGDLSRAAAIGEAEVGWLCGTGCFLLRLAGSSLSPDFASLVYRQSFVQRQVDARAVGATMPSLNNAVMSSLLYPFCATKEQELIVEMIASSENVLAENLKNRRALEQQKRGLMQDLLTGRVSV